MRIEHPRLPPAKTEVLITGGKAVSWWKTGETALSEMRHSLSVDTSGINAKKGEGGRRGGASLNHAADRQLQINIICGSWYSPPQVLSRLYVKDTLTCATQIITSMISGVRYGKLE